MLANVDTHLVVGQVDDHAAGILDAPAEIDVGGAKFDLYTSGDGAWARNDKAVVQAMLKGKSFVVHGVPAKGEPTADTYSLDGFPKAYADISKACGAK